MSLNHRRNRPRKHRWLIALVVLSCVVVACGRDTPPGQGSAAINPLDDSSWPTEIFAEESSKTRKQLLASIKTQELSAETAALVFTNDFQGEDIAARRMGERRVQTGVVLASWTADPPELDAEAFRQSWNSFLGEFSEILTLETHTWELQERPQASGEPGLECHVALWMLGRLPDGRLREERFYLVLDLVKLGEDDWRIAKVYTEEGRTVIGPGHYFQDVTAQVLPPGYDQIGAQIYTDGGPVLADFDGDHDVDLFLPRIHAPARLYQNSGRGQFDDVTAERGLELTVLKDGSNSGLFLDLDRDGRLDLVVSTKDRGLHLFLNEGNRFRNATGAEPPVGAGEWESLAAADYDGDGWVDIYLCNYNRIDAEHQPESYVNARDGLDNVLLRNLGLDENGNPRFADVTESAGMGENRERWSYAAAWADYDRDGAIDLYVANDYGPNSLYRNLGDGRFEEITEAVGAEDRGNGMGVSWADLDGDLWLDLYISNMQSFAGNRITLLERFPGSSDQRQLYRRFSRGNTLLRNLGDGTFQDRTQEAGVKGAFWAWGNLAFDFDADCDLDLFANGGFYTGASAKDT